MRGSIGRRLLLDVGELLPELIDLAPQCTESIRVVASVISRHGGTDGLYCTRTRNALYRRETSQNLPHRAACWRLDSVSIYLLASALYAPASRLHVELDPVPRGSLHTSLRRAARMAPSDAGTSEHGGPSEPFEDDLVQLAASSPSVGARTAHCVDGTVPRLAGLPTPASFRELVAP